MTEINYFKSYLKSQFKIDKDTKKVTHTWMNRPGLSLNISNEELNEFYEKYYEAVFKNKENCFLTEVPDSCGYCQLKVDLDFKHKIINEDDNKRKYTNDHITKIIRLYMNICEEYLKSESLQKKNRLCFIFEKDTPSIVRKDNNIYLKDGIHIMFPFLILPWAFQLKIRDYVYKKSNDILKNLNLINPPSDVFDLSIIHRNNWLMYGSKKPNGLPYLLTQIYQIKSNKMKKIKNIHEKYSNKILIELLSIRNHTQNYAFFKEDKWEKIEAENKKQIRIKSSLLKAPKRSKKKYKREISKKHLESIISLVDLLNKNRFENRNSWIEIVWCLHNIHNKDDILLEKMIKRSQGAEGYTNEEAEGSCTKEWNNAYDEGLGEGTLRMWVKEDNKDGYMQFQKDTVWEQMIEALKNPQPLPYDFAEILYTIYKDEYVCASYTKNLWYHFEKHLWIQLEYPVALKNKLSIEVYNMIRTYVMKYYDKSSGELGDDSHKKAMRTLRAAGSLKCTSFKNNVISESKEVFYDKTQEFVESLDEKRHLLGLKNGVYDLDKMELRSGRPEDKITLCCGVEYPDEYDCYLYDKKSTKKINWKEINKEGKSIGINKIINNAIYDTEKYNGFLEDNPLYQIMTSVKQILPSEKKREYVLKLLASYLNGSTKNEKFIIWTGSGSNGKSLLTDLYEMTIDTYACRLPVALLTKKRAASNAASPELARTKGRRFAVLQEPDQKSRINVGLMKELTGGDKIQCRELFQNPIEFKPQFKLILCCNELPSLPPDDGGTWRRVRLVDFTSKFVDEPDPDNKNEFPIDRTLKDKFEEWKEPFFWLLLQYYKKYEVEGLKEPPEVLEATKKYREKIDIIQQFIGEEIIITKNKKDILLLEDAYDLYKEWLKKMHPYQKIMNSKDFKDILSSKLKKPYQHSDTLVHKKRVKKGWIGFKLRYDDNSSDSDSDVEDKNQIIQKNQTIKF